MTAPSPRSPLRRHERQVFYKYTSADTARLILTNRTFRWSSPLILNDPFDIPKELRLGFSEHELSVRLAHGLATLIEGKYPPAIVSRPQIALVLRAAAALKDKGRSAVAAEIRATADEIARESTASLAPLKDHWRELVPTMRIFCVSEDFDIIPMWLQYGKEHTGIVLELKANDETDSPLIVAQQVTYRNTLPPISDIDIWVKLMLGLSDIGYKHLFNEIQHTKTESWAFEREWRVMNYARRGESGLYSDWHFNAADLRRVIYGARCTEESRAQISALLTGQFSHVEESVATINQAAGRITAEPC